MLFGAPAVYRVFMARSGDGIEVRFLYVSFYRLESSIATAVDARGGFRLNILVTPLQNRARMLGFFVGNFKRSDASSSSSLGTSSILNMSASDAVTGSGSKSSIYFFRGI